MTSPVPPDWTEEFPGAITVTDANGTILSMNRAARSTFAGGEGRLIGADVLACHPEPARSLLADLYRNPRSHSYTIEKKGVRKFIHQAPYFRDGVFAGFVEISVVISEALPQHVRG